MPTITLNRKSIERLIGKKLPLDKLKNSIEMLGTDLSSITENEIIVEVFPNRPDMLSEQGFARALSSFIGSKKSLKEYKVKDSKQKVIIDSSVNEVRPFTACAIVKNLKFDNEKVKEVINIQEKLHITYGRNRKKVAIGIYPFEKIKTPIKYLAKKPSEIKFQPLESSKEMTAPEILQKYRDYAHLLEDKTKFPIFIDSNNEILSMPPIINSHTTGKITEKTKDIFIECSGFDFRVLSKCLNIIVTSLADMGGEIYSMDLIYKNKKIKSPNLESEKIKLDLSYVNKLLGLSLTETQVKNLLEKMNYTYKDKTVHIPCYRTDILHQIDIVEDIAIAYGYENFKPEIPQIATIASQNKEELLHEKISQILVGFNFVQCNTFHITNKENLCNKMNYNIKFVELKNALTQEYNILRSWLSPSLIEVLSKNKHNEYPQKIFEIAKVFTPDLEEPFKLSTVISSKETDFTEIKQLLDSLLLLLDIQYKIEPIEHSSFILGRIGKIISNNKEVGFIGEVHPSVISSWDLKMPVVAFEIDLTKLF